MTKIIFKILLLCLSVETVQLQALNWFTPRKTIDPILALFLKKYAPPASIIPQLNKVLKKQSFGEHEKVPGYFLKGQDTDRLINAIRLKNFIKKENLTYLDVPEKYIYCKDSECMIIAKLIEEGKFSQNSGPIEEELLAVAEKTGFSDWHLGNLIFGQSEKLYFIDTENASFAPLSNSIADFPSGTAVQGVGHLYRKIGGEQIYKRLNVLINDEDARTKVITPIYNNGALDPEDFDLAEIRALLHNYTNGNLELNHELMQSVYNQFE